MSLKSYLILHEEQYSWIFKIRKEYLDLKRYVKTIDAIKKGKRSNKPVIYYCGIPAHGNLGDLAQGVCIRQWLKKHYNDFYVTEIETDSLVNTNHSCVKALTKSFSSDKDFVLFQSGYTTTDLGGYADEMHQFVMQALPEARILMMPQTIFFKTDERKVKCSQVYNNHQKMLYLARDRVSFDMTKEMFPDIPCRCFPDIVTTMIGSYKTSHVRDGIIFCLRDDGEKFYTDEQLEILISECRKIARCGRTDTTKDKKVVSHPSDYINSEIEEYSRYKVMVTDRYHGTILSLVAGTPVVVLKTNDHKVITGTEWFEGIYDDYVHKASDLDEAYRIVKKIYSNDSINHNIRPYFEGSYYDKLPALFEELV